MNAVNYGLYGNISHRGEHDFVKFETSEHLVITAACDYLSPPRSSRIDHSSNKCTPLCVSAPLI